MTKEEISWIVRTADHRSHYITGAVGSVTRDDIRLHVFNEIVEAKDRTICISNAQIIMSRSTAKALIEALQGALEKGDGDTTKVVSIPQEAAFWMEGGNTDVKKKVQKIRVK